MKPIFKIILIFGIIIFYIITINFFSSLISFSYEPQSTRNKIGGADLEISVGDIVSVQVTRAGKWYGQFHENNGEKYLNLFYICNLPIKIKRYNFIWFHLIFLATLTLLIILMFTKRQKEVNLKNEKLGEDFDNLGDIVYSNDARS